MALYIKNASISNSILMDAAMGHTETKFVMELSGNFGALCFPVNCTLNYKGATKILWGNGIIKVWIIIIICLGGCFSHFLLPVTLLMVTLKK